MKLKNEFVFCKKMQCGKVYVVKWRKSMHLHEHVVDEGPPSSRPLEKVVNEILWLAVPRVSMSVGTRLEGPSEEACARHLGGGPRCAAKGTVWPGIALPGLELTKFQQVGFRVAVVKRRQLDVSLPRRQLRLNRGTRTNTASPSEQSHRIESANCAKTRKVPHNRYLRPVVGVSGQLVQGLLWRHCFESLLSHHSHKCPSWTRVEHSAKPRHG